MSFYKKGIYTYFCLQAVRVGPDPREAHDHHHPHLYLKVLDKYPQAPQGPLCGPESHSDHVGLAQISQMNCLCNVYRENCK